MIGSRNTFSGMLLALGVVSLLEVTSPFALAADRPLPARQALAVLVPQLDVDGQPLEKVIRHIRDVTGSNLVVNWKVLDAVNVAKDTPITLSVRNVTVHKLLRLVLEQASPNTPLTWTIDQNVISVTSQEEADKQLVTRVYVVDDLVMSDNRTLAPPAMNLSTITTSSSSSGSGTTGGSLFEPNTSANADADTPAKRGEELCQLIREIVRPSIWKENGGQASVKYFSGKLIITAPVSVQEAIGGSRLPEGGQRLTR